MSPDIPSQIDPGLSTLFGAFIGAGASVLVQIVAAIVAARAMRIEHRRSARGSELASVSDAYEHALNVIFNMMRGSQPDRATHGHVFAQISLRGSPQVRELILAFLDLERAEMAGFDPNPVIEAMKRHVEKLESGVNA